MNQNYKIVFYSRKNKGVTGDFSLFYRIGTWFAEKFGREVYCVNNSSPEIKEQYKNSKIHFCDLDDTNIKDFEGSIFISPFNQLFSMIEETEKIKDVKYFYIFGHPEIMHWFENQLVYHNHSSVIKMLVETNSYGLQDEANLIAIKDYTNVKVPARYFPILLDDKLKQKACVFLPKLSENTINFVWLGRLDSDKVLSVVNLLDNLYESLGDYKANVHLIGDGDALYRIDADRYAPKITIYFNSYLFGEDKDRYIQQNADVTVAMGVSTLDTAMNGMPTIIPIVSPNYFRDDKFVYLFESVNYNIGWLKENLDQINCKKHHISDIINDIMVKDKKIEYGKLCRDYAINTFSAENNIDSMLKMIEDTTLTKKRLLHNRTIRFQMMLFKLYRLLTKHRKDYEQFVEFKHSLGNFLYMSPRQKLSQMKIWVKIIFT